MYKDAIIECEETNSNERSLAMDVICYVNSERRKWKAACILMSVLELFTVAGIIFYIVR